jgi:hypothetical protein
MALTMFIMHGYIYSKIELVPINLTPYLFSSFLGVTFVLLYLYLFPSQRKNSFLTFFFLGMFSMITLILTGIANIWLVDEFIFSLAFIFGGQEVSSIEVESIEQR